MRLARLQSSCELIGNRLRHLLDLVEEQRAARSELETSLMADLRALHDAEELLLEKLRRRIAAAQRNERSRRAVARLMDAMRHALLARAGLALDQDMVVVLGHAARFIADTQERRAVADHRVEAVLGRIASGMGHERAQILDRHRYDHDALHGLVFIALQRHDGRDVLIGLSRRDPGDFLVVGRHTAEALVDRRMLIVHDDIVEILRMAAAIALLGTDAFKARMAELVRIGDLAPRHDMVDRKRRRVKDGLLGLDAQGLGQMLLQCRPHCQQQ